MSKPSGVQAPIGVLMCGAIDVRQIDACRTGGVDEVLAVTLMAKKYAIGLPPLTLDACHASKT